VSSVLGGCLSWHRLLTSAPFFSRPHFHLFLFIINAVLPLRPRHPFRQLYPEEIIAALTAPLFLVYSAVCVAAIIALVNLSRTRYGDKWVMIDLGICALSVSGLASMALPSSFL
jgi:hypothetical protein